MIPEPSVQKLCCRYVSRDSAPQLCLLTGVVFRQGLHLLQEVSLMRGEDYTYVWVERQICSHGLLIQSQVRLQPTV